MARSKIMKKLFAGLCAVLALFLLSSVDVFAKGKTGDVHVEGDTSKNAKHYKPSTERIAAKSLRDTNKVQLDNRPKVNTNRHSAQKGTKSEAVKK